MLIKLLLIENNFRSAMHTVSVLKQLEHIMLCGVATSYDHGISMIRQQQPNIVLMELSHCTEQSFSLSSSIKQQFPQIHIIIFTGYDYAPFFNQLIESGVSGMLYKTASPQELELMFCNVLRGNTIIPLSLYRHIKLHRSDSLKHYWEIEMTPTEQYLLELIYKRHTNASIAQKIHVSESSVEKYLRKLYDKLGVRNKNQVIERMKRDQRLRPVALTNNTAPSSLIKPNGGSYT